jgi:transcriptional antiterminator Rof (Rho-off)
VNNDLLSLDPATINSSNYQPVACSVYDDLGLRLMRGTASRLVVEGDDGPETLETTIDDLYTQGDAEYLRLENGRIVRLDRVVEVDDAD